MVELVASRGTPPADDVLRAELGVAGRCTYIVATAALEGHRAAIAPGGQREVNKVHLTFPRAVRWLMPERPFTRGEQRVLLGRAADAVARSDRENL